MSNKHITIKSRNKDKAKYRINTDFSAFMRYSDKAEDKGFEPSRRLPDLLP